jgi:hypothetical protein
MEAQLEDALVAQEYLQEAVESLLAIFITAGAENPQILAKTDAGGRTALHIGCKASSSACTILELAKLLPEAINRKDYICAGNMTPLCYAVERTDLPVKVNHALCDEGLHRAFTLGASLDVIRKLLDRCDPRNLCMKDKVSLLHTAVKCNDVSVEAIELLIDACPQNLTKVNQDNETPLHIACNNNAASDLLHLLMSRGPQAARMKDCLGNYPLHLISGYKDPDLVPHMFHLYPPAICQSNYRGRTPLHMACEWHNSKVGEIHFLVHHFQIACLFSDSDNSRPYDLVIRRFQVDYALEEFLANVTKDVSGAMMECILHPKSAVSPTAIQHVRNVITTALPNANAIRNSSQDLIHDVWPHLNQDILQTLVRNNDLQNLFKEDEHFQNLICSLMHMNSAGRSYFQRDPCEKLTGLSVLESTGGNVDCLFVHLRENPSLCVRSKPVDMLTGLCHLESKSVSVISLYSHLRENPYLCDRSLLKGRASRKRKVCS